MGSKTLKLTKEVEVSADIVVPISRTYRITKTLEIDSHQLKESGQSIDEFIDENHSDEFVEEPEILHEQDWERDRFKDEVQSATKNSKTLKGRFCRSFALCLRIVAWRGF